MDKELAHKVLERWENGNPISETSLYKAAQAIGINPMAALVEARFFTYLDNYFLEKRAMSRAERAVFSAAASMPLGVMVKTASVYGFSPDELIVEALRERNFVPDLSKIANLAMMQAQPSGPGQGPPPGMPGQSQPGAQPPGMMQQPGPEQQAGDVMTGPPQEGAMLQQQPQARFKPSPTGPEQTPPSPMGNLEDLVQQGQSMFGEQATENGGTAPQGMPEPAPAPPSPEERIQQVGPNLDPETVARYAEQLARFEEGFQMQVSDPKQMVKFVKELQKVDGKKVDQGIKAMGQQLEQEQAQELGVDSTPTIDGPGGMGAPGGGGPGQGMAPKSESPDSPQQAGSPPEAQQAAQLGGMDNEQDQEGMEPPQQPPSQSPFPKKPPQQQQAANAAVEKVANAARIIARYQHR